MSEKPRKRLFDLRGESRTQAVLRTAQPGEQVILVRDPDNAHDPNAIKVVNGRHEVMGWIAREDAVTLAPCLDEGELPEAQVHELRGGVKDYPSYGCRISIRWPGEKARTAKALEEDQIAFRSKGKSGCLAMAAVLLLPMSGTLSYFGLPS